MKRRLYADDKDSKEDDEEISLDRIKQNVPLRRVINRRYREFMELHNRLMSGELAVHMKGIHFVVNLVDKFDKVGRGPLSADGGAACAGFLCQGYTHPLCNAISIESWIPIDQTGWVVMVEVTCQVVTDASFLMLDHCLAPSTF